MPIALSGGNNVYGEFKAATQYTFVQAVSYFLQKAGWQVTETVAATAPALAFASYPNIGDSVSAGGINYTFVDTFTAKNQVFRGATALDAITNLVAAVNGTSGAGTRYSVGTLPNPLCVVSSSTSASITFSSKWPGPAGNGTPTSAGQLWGGGYILKGTSAQNKASNSAIPLSVSVYVCDDGTSGLLSGPLAMVQMISTEPGNVAANPMYLSLNLSGMVYYGPQVGIINASNTSPIVLTLASGFNGVQGQHINVGGVNGNTAANGEFIVAFDEQYPRYVTLYSKVNSDGSLTTPTAGNGAFTSSPHAALSTINTTQVFRIIANRCQFFIYVPGIDGSSNGSFAAGGIPWIPPVNCANNVVAVACNEAWWCWSDRGGIDIRNSPRTVINGVIGRVNRDGLNLPTGPSIGQAMYNGVLASGDGALRLCSLTGSENLGFYHSFGGVLSPATWVGDQPLWFEPLIAWPDSLSSPVLIRGQLYDALIRSTQANMDDTDTHQDGPVSRSYVCMTDRYFYGTLALMVQDLTPGNFVRPEDHSAW